MKLRIAYLLALALLGAGILVPGALADAESDFQAVYRDWRTDKNVTSCGFTRAQLVNARNEADKTPDIEQYAPGFRDEVTIEIRRRDSGGCRGVTSPPTDPRITGSHIFGVRISKIRPRGGARRESVVLRNRSRRTVNLRGATLRDRAGNRVRMPRRNARIRRGRSVRVFTGCRKGIRRRSSFRRGRRIYGCRLRQLWNARGDVVKFVDRDGVVIAQRGYGRYRNVPKF